MPVITGIPGVNSNLLSRVYGPPRPAPRPIYDPGRFRPAPYPAPRPTVLGASTSRSGGGGGGGGVPSSIPTSNPGPQYQQLQDQQDAINEQLEADYNQAMNELSNQESGLRGQAGIAEGQISNEAATVRTKLGQEQGIKEQGVQASLSTAETQGKGAMQQARDVFRQTQQSNIAQLSALGISSSSVSEALAERLGVETARRIAGITGSLQEVRQNATNELGRIKGYFSERSTQLQEQVQLQKSQIQQGLIQGINSINSARQQAASDKAAQRSNLLSQVSQAIASLTQQHQQFQQALQQWAQQKSAALTPIVQDPNYYNTLMNKTADINKQFATTQFSYAPNFNSQGRVTGYGRVNTRREEEDDDDRLRSPFT